MYPRTLYMVVNSQEEEDAARAVGGKSDDQPRQEYPKMLYLHPVDKTKEHKFIVVDTPEEKDSALEQGYRLEPHIPAVTEDPSCEVTVYEEAPGSGTGRWPEADDWTKTVGAGLSADTTPVEADDQSGAEASEEPAA